MNHILLCAECKRRLNPDDSMVKYIAENDPFRVCFDCYINGGPHYPPQENAEKV